MGLSPLFATLTPQPFVIPISNGSGLLDDWVTPALSNPMTTDQDIIVAGVGVTPNRLGVGPIGYVLTVGSGGLVDWEPSSGGFTNPMIAADDLIVGGIAGAATRLAVGSVGQVLTVGSSGSVDWETPSAGFTNPMTTNQDIIVGGIAGVAGRLGVGTLGQVLTVGSGGLIDWENPAAGTSGANPSAQVGLAAVNGVATTYMRSDGAPALSQAITPTWTGAHVFQANATLGKVGGPTAALDLLGLTSGAVTLSVNDVAGTWTMKLPNSGGTNGYVLGTDGSGNTSWVIQAALDYLALQVFF